MAEVFEFCAGTSPLLVSIPHDGREVPSTIRSQMTPAGLDIPDTDWHVAALYDFVTEMGASVIVANYSRYVVDLNRPTSDNALYEGQVSTGLCPTQTFAGEQIYSDNAEVSAMERRQRVEQYWRPYHDKITHVLDSLLEHHGHALLWDAHSIPSRVPRLFDGELPVLNIGTDDGRSCSHDIAATVTAIANASAYEAVHNARFKGGYITRHYGDPQNGIQALQLEIAQRAYMDEQRRNFDASKAAALQSTLTQMLVAFVTAAVVRLT